jgi:hypothetical protein
VQITNYDTVAPSLAIALKERTAGSKAVGPVSSRSINFPVRLFVTP